MRRQKTIRRKQRRKRRGAAVVEFAIVAPLFLALLLGVVEISRMMEVENLLSVAAREGGRLGSMDREGLLASGQSSSEKIIADVLGFLESSGLPADKVNVYVSEVDDLNTAFDLDDASNALRLFQVSVQIPFNEVGYGSYPGTEDASIMGKVVFRNGRSSMVQ